MKGTRKEFEPEMYTKFDAPAKEAMRIHLVGHGHTVTVPPENYGVDLYSQVGPVVMYHEVEVFVKWKKKRFPFITGSIPERKHRLKEQYPCVPLYFWRLRCDLRRALVYNAKHLADEWLVEVHNCKVDKGEYFYRIPVELGKEFDLICQ